MEIPLRRRHPPAAQPGEGKGQTLNVHRESNQSTEASVVLSSYTRRLGQLQTQLAVVKVRRLRTLVLSAACLLLGIATIALALRHVSHALELCALPFAAALYLS